MIDQIAASSPFAAGLISSIPFLLIHEIYFCSSDQISKIFHRDSLVISPADNHQRSEEGLSALRASSRIEHASSLRLYFNVRRQFNLSSARFRWVRSEGGLECFTEVRTINEAGLRGDCD
jgi:hypothetical protein